MDKLFIFNFENYTMYTKYSTIKIREGLYIQWLDYAREEPSNDGTLTWIN